MSYTRAAAQEDHALEASGVAREVEEHARVGRDQPSGRPRCGARAWCAVDDEIHPVRGEVVRTASSSSSSSSAWEGASTRTQARAAPSVAPMSRCRRLEYGVFAAWIIRSQFLEGLSPAGLSWPGVGDIPSRQ